MENEVQTKNRDNAPDICHAEFVHEDILKAVTRGMPDNDELLALADTFKVLGDPTRIRILQALSMAEMCVCDLARLMAMTSSAVSHQLRVLRAAKIVKYRRQGKMAIYSLDDSHIETLMAQGLEHVREG